MQKMIQLAFVSFSIIWMIACNNTLPQKESLKLSEPPAWAASAIWYQIFPERFCNGDTSNDPNLATMTGALNDIIPENWTITPWTHEWYKQEDWAKSTGKDFYTTIQMRRYGGDIQGILDKIPYLKSLGVNAIYLNPINDAPSLHKYDARNYHHVDVTFGKSINQDLSIIRNEDPADPETWKYTTADSLFISLISKLHAEGMRLVLDYSWNHTGTQFWAFQDIIKNQSNSKFKDWYEIKSFDDPNTSENEFDYDGWLGIKSLPELKKIKQTPKNFGHPYEGNMPDDVKKHIFAVCKRWMDPNNDGDPSDGIDGMRLDVAEHVPMGFWRDFRKYVRSVNNEFYLIGENWWTSWPDTLMDAEPWMRGDVFDAVMHYQWYKPSRYLLIDGPLKINVPTYQQQIDSIFQRYRPETIPVLMNLGASHDSPRLLTSLANTNKYKYNSSMRENANYICWQPDSIAYLRMMALTTLQFSFAGSPQIYNGDEMGMWGSDDPDNRKPLWWPESQYDPEHYSVNEKTTVSKPKMNAIIHSHYHHLCSLRQSYECFKSNNFSFKDSGSDEVLIFERSKDKDILWTVINTSSKKITIDWKYGGESLIKSGNVKMEGNSLELGPYASTIMSL